MDVQKYGISLDTDIIHNNRLLYGMTVECGGKQINPHDLLNVLHISHDYEYSVLSISCFLIGFPMY